MSALPRHLFAALVAFFIFHSSHAAEKSSPLTLWYHASATNWTSALPQAWPTGSVKGLRARGNFTVDIEWQNGKLVSTTLHSPVKNSGQVRYGGKLIDVKIKAGGTVHLNQNLE